MGTGWVFRPIRPRINLATPTFAAPTAVARESSFSNLCHIQTFARKEALYPMKVIFAYMARHPSLPVPSVVAIVFGVGLMFGRNTLKLVTRWIRLATIARSRD
jgi:hypothetical protein